MNNLEDVIKELSNLVDNEVETEKINLDDVINDLKDYIEEGNNANDD